MNETHQITQMLREWSEGSRKASENLMPLVYDELHRQAVRFLRHEGRDHTLQATALIHETYLKLIDQREVNWESRTHFFAIAANLMRRILVDYARAKHREKRGGDAVKLSLAKAELPVSVVKFQSSHSRLALSKGPPCEGASAFTASEKYARP